MAAAPWRVLHALPAYAVNGIAVALGVALVQALAAAGGGAHAAAIAASGAVCTSLADQPNTVRRTAVAVLTAAGLSFVATAVVVALVAQPLALGAGTAVIAFAAMMMLAWGPRAGPVSFAAVLAMVFAMASATIPQAEDTGLAWHLAWEAAGALAYVGWSLASGAVLERRYRRLALGSALEAAAALLRSRAAVLRPLANAGASDAPAAGWIRQEAALAERLQAARDLVFPAANELRAHREAQALVRVIDVRDVLLASRLDIEALGDDALAQRVREEVAGGLERLADELDRVRLDALGVRRLRARGDDERARAGALDTRWLPASDPRSRLVAPIANRLGYLAADIAAIPALLDGRREDPSLPAAQLLRFVSPTGWPVSALRAQFALDSRVLRHALRMAMALASAYYIARALPWASHPYWLVLSVAVVLRGNLEQTLSRRNARVAGTLLGCLVVLGIARLPSAALLSAAFLVAVGVAHSFANVRYLITATAGTVMALLQSHLAVPGTGFPIAERMADTVLGAALAWGFSYVLASWERQGTPLAIGRVLQALREYAALALGAIPDDSVEQRLARRRAYDALGALAAAVQRSSVEPQRVRLPMRELGVLLDHAYGLMAHLSMVRLTLARRGSEISGSELESALAEAAAALQRALALHDVPPEHAAGDPNALALLPAQPPSLDLRPWLARRLQASVHEGWRVGLAASAALARLGEHGVAAIARIRKRVPSA